jgi:hypothetical protein
MLRATHSLFPRVAIVLFSLALFGCESMKPAADSASAEKSVIAGGTTFVQVNAGQGPPVMVAYTTPGKPVCLECEAVAEKYFETGVLDESVCKTCGAHLYVGQSEVIQPK